MAGKNWLAVHLEHKMPDENTVVAWALMDSANTLLCQGQGPLGRVRVQAGPAAEKAEVVIFVPGSAVNLAEVNIPSRQSAHIRKALPYMIEDQVAGDLRQTHLAISPQRFGDSVPVGIVAHSQMIAWLEVLHAAGLSPVAMIPEHLLLPREPGSIFVHVHWSRSHVKLGVCRGIVVENENVALMLGLALKQRAMPCSRIEISACAASPDDIARADLLATEVEQSLQLPVRRTNYTETLVELLARQARGADPILNLCQGGYRPAGGGSESAGDWGRAWIAAAAGFAVFAIVSMGSAWSLESRALETYDASVKEFRRMFPDEHRIVNLRRQAERRLAAGTAKGSDGMRSLAALASAMAEPELQGISVKNLRYDSASGALGAEVNAPAMAQLDKLGQVLGSAGASARVLSASEDAGLASARLELRSN